MARIEIKDLQPTAQDKQQRAKGIFGGYQSSLSSFGGYSSDPFIKYTSPTAGDYFFKVEYSSMSSPFIKFE